MNITALQESNGLSPFALTYWKKQNEGSCFSPEAAVATAVAVTQGWPVGAGLHRSPLFCQLNVILLHVGAINFPK